MCRGRDSSVLTGRFSPETHHFLLLRKRQEVSDSVLLPLRDAQMELRV